MSNQPRLSEFLPKPQSERFSREFTVCLATLILIGIGIRFFRLDVALVGHHQFRQTQTAFTARCYLRDGINLLHTPLPVFGTSTDVPFEMPLFQACVVGVVRVTGINLDFACRLTNVLFFIASALVVFLLTSMLFNRKSAWVGLLFYVWSPQTICYSRTSLMEFMAVFFALAYTATFLWMLKASGRLWIAPIVILVGCGGALVKITTMAITVPIIVGIVISNGRSLMRAGNQASAPRKNWLLWITIIASVCVPLIVGQSWVWHTDAIKSSQALTGWLTSGNLKAWNYGTLRQRLTLNLWVGIARTLNGMVAPRAISGLAIVAVVFIPRTEQRVYLWALSAGVAFPIVLFFNLYAVHDYYVCAVSPFVAIVCGVGFWLLWDRWEQRAVLRVTLVVAVILSELVCWKKISDTFSTAKAQETSSAEYQVGMKLKELSPPDKYVVVCDNDWSPSILYYADRRGLQWRVSRDDGNAPITRSNLGKMIRAMGSNNISTVVYRNADPGLMSMWPKAAQVGEVQGFAIVRVE